MPIGKECDVGRPEIILQLFFQNAVLCAVVGKPSAFPQVFYFPAGACSRKIDGKIQDLPWKKSFITKSRESKRDIIPMWFSGRNSNRFYNVDWIRKKLKIKTNIAMFFLPDEVYRSRNKEYTMVIGKPIPYTTFTSEKSDAEWAAWVRGKTYELNNAE